MEAAVSLSGGGSMYLGWLGHGYGLAGDSTSATSILRDLISAGEDGYVPSIDIAHVYLGLGDLDNGFEWLNRAFDERDDQLPRLRYFPVFEGIRSDPRYDDLVRRIGFPD
jgi:hypothetical protein